MKPEDIGAFFFVSVTGVCSPSIEARLINKMKLNPNTKRISIFGLGCMAGAAGVASAADYVKAYPKQAALLLSVELCSLTVQPDDLSAANLISTGLFGDGGAAVVIAGDECPGACAGPQILATCFTFYPDTEDVMGWDITEKGFRIILSREVPNVILENLGRDADGFLADNGLKRCDIQNWVIHTGGPNLGRYRSRARFEERRAGSFVEMFAQNRKSFVRFCSVCSRGNHEKPPSRTRYLRDSGGNGAWFLF